ncbi:unnamed protein product (mitochondrion) [Plasmodiophora brassicae]|uniref:Small ribosomal subunit protein mS33 n=1 Tax=Plasmodiophora brassicae TaxID=37360 RepID=A0A3P3Y2J9_PLABS|nr:unnamed protein product [Plasmodiophora brassicae]
MGPKKDEAFKHFGPELPPLDGQKTPRHACNYCNASVVKNVDRMRNHFNTCKARQNGSIGVMRDVVLVSRKKAAIASTSAATTLTPARPVGHSSRRTFDSSHSSCPTASISSWLDSMPSEEQNMLEELFSRAMHRSSMVFSTFETKYWKEFFHRLRPAWAIPTASRIGGELLVAEYNIVMRETISHIREWPLVCITIDGATNVVGKQVLNIMACGPHALFLEHCSMGLLRESSENLLDVLVDAKRRLRAMIRQPLDGFVAAGSFDDERPNSPRLAISDDHFVDPPMWTFQSDSPSVMKKLRRLCVDNKEFMFSYGCAAHALHNFCMDLVRKFPTISKIVKESIYIVKGINAVHRLTEFFDAQCLLKYRKRVKLILFSKTRWGSILCMLDRLARVQAVLFKLSRALELEDMVQDLKIDATLDVCLRSPAYWEGVSALKMLLQPICCCLAFLEGDESTLSTVYASFVAIAYHLRSLPVGTVTALGLQDADLKNMENLIFESFKTIACPAHALAFATDPFFSRAVASTVADALNALKTKLVQDIRHRVFGTCYPPDNRRSGRKELRKALKGPKVAAHYPFLYHHGFDGLYEDNQVLYRQDKLVELRKRGKGPPKKGQGRRASKKK